MSKHAKQFALSEDIVVDSESDGSAGDFGAHILSRLPNAAAADNAHIQPRDDILLHDYSSGSDDATIQSSMQKEANVAVASPRGQLSYSLLVKGFNIADSVKGRKPIKFSVFKSSSYGRSSSQSAASSNAEDVQGRRHEIGHEAEYGDKSEASRQIDREFSSTSPAPQATPTIVQPSANT